MALGISRVWRRRLLRVGVGITGVVAALLLVVLVAGWSAFGQRASGPRRERVAASPEWQEAHFENPEPLWNDGWGMVKGLLAVSDHASPHGPVPVVHPGVEALRAPTSTGLRVTWLGHSAALVDIDGVRILTDPVWSLRASPVAWAGPKRWYAPLVALADLPPLDAVVISHDHYDHLDEGTIRALAGSGATFVVPLGVGAHLVYWGVPETRIVELDWWQRTKVRDLEIVATPARHASGRMPPLDFDATLWAGYAFLGAEHRVYFSGDTGLFPALRDIGAKLGPFDLTMIEVGQYHAAWPDWHIGPEQAVRAHQLVKGRMLLPIHWGLFTLAYHGWTEPAERVLAAAGKAGVDVALPRPGESFEPSGDVPHARWWPELPWQTAEAAPIVSTKVDELRP